MSSMRVRVRCYAGRKADERPVSFALGGRECIVEEVLDQWYGPDDTFFKVRADDGSLYILQQSAATHEWTCTLLANNILGLSGL